MTPAVPNQEPAEASGEAKEEKMDVEEPGQKWAKMDAGPIMVEVVQVEVINHFIGLCDFFLSSVLYLPTYFDVT